MRQAFITALSLVMQPQRQGGARMTIEQAVERANRVDWSIKNHAFQQIAVNENYTVNPYNEAKRRSAMLMAYLIAGDVMSKEEIDATWKAFNEARGHDIETDEVEDLPDPIGAAA